MRLVPNTAIRSEVEIVAIVRLSPSELAKAVPVSLEPLDSFAEPEPSRGATIELASGRFVVVIYGEVTGRLSVHAPGDMPEAVDDFLREARIAASSVEWTSAALAASSSRGR